MYMYVHMQVGACVEAREENQLSSIVLCLIPLKQGLSGNLTITTLAEIPGREVPVISQSPPTNTGFIACASLPDFYMVAGDSNTIPCAYIASPLAHGSISSVLSTCILSGLENTCTSVIYHMFFAKPSKDFSKMLMDILAQYWQ